MVRNERLIMMGSSKLLSVRPKLGFLLPLIVYLSEGVSSPDSRFNELRYSGHDSAGSYKENGLFREFASSIALTAPQLY